MRKYLLVSAALSLALSACDTFPDINSAPTTPVVATETPEPEATVYPGGMELVESVTRSGDEIIIPYKKFRMPNGLTVILHEDNSDPLVHVDVTYHVGSGREEVGKSGFAHFFEHMMFQGSENVADE
ncbi:MAG: insulinase family protein, partial [Pseudomonadota bacterium]